MISNIFAPGTYYIGDPCYVIADDKWDDFCDYLAIAERLDGSGGVFEFEGHKVFAANTALGDGSYTDNNGHEYGVDAGLIGIIPIELCIKTPPDELDVVGRVVTFDVAVVPSCGDGVFYFGGVCIDTGFSAHESDEDNFFEEEDDFSEDEDY